MDRERERRGSARTLTALSNPDTLTLPSCTRPLHTSPSHVPFIRPLKPEPVAPPPFSNTPRVVSSRPLLQKAPPPPRTCPPRPAAADITSPPSPPNMFPPPRAAANIFGPAVAQGLLQRLHQRLPHRRRQHARHARQGTCQSRPPGNVPFTPAMWRASHARQGTRPPARERRSMKRDSTRTERRQSTIGGMDGPSVKANERTCARGAKHLRHEADVLRRDAVVSVPPPQGAQRRLQRLEVPEALPADVRHASTRLPGSKEGI